MNEIQKNHKYFINDIEITTNKDDKFKHDDIAKNIVSIIENYEPSYNIALVGKWGIGKSSLINIVKEKLQVNKSYIIEDVNAWKYEKEALKRVLLRKTLSNLGYKDKSFLDKFFSYTGTVEEEQGSFWDKFKREWLPILGNSLMIYIIGILLSFLGNRILISIKDEGFDLYNFVNYIFNNLVSNFYTPILLVLFGKYINVSSGKHNFKVVPPITTTDEYETILEKEINNSKSSKFKDKKFIIIVDDLDRLTPNKIVEALDAIKVFVGYKNFIFIVPFDETILKDAIQREKTKFRNNEHLAIESDLFLDKLFQYRIFLPSTIQSDMPTYAIEMARNDAKDLVKLCGDEEFELICKEILIHKKVATPRQAKKIINTFANNLLLGYRREEKDVEQGVFTSDISKRNIAKISVLQCDFSNFYTSLFVDNNLIKNFLDFAKVVIEDKEASEDCENINELLIPYFDKIDTKFKLNKTGESLFMFLNRTSNIEFNNITRYLYLDDDRLSHLFGNEFSSSLREYLTSGVYQLAKENIQQNLDKEIGLLLYEILTNSDPIDFENCCIGIINLTEIDIISTDTRLLKVVNDKLEGIFKTKDKINSKDLEISKAIEIYKMHKSFKGIDQLIINEYKEDNVDIINLLNIFFKNESNLSEDLKKYIKNDIIAKSSIEESGLKFNKLFTIDLNNVEMFFEPYFSEMQIFVRLSDEICEEELFDPSYGEVATFVKLFEKHSNSSNSNEVLDIISKKLDYSAFTELLVKVILNNVLNYTDIDINSKVCIALMEYDNKEEFKNIIIKIIAMIDWRLNDDMQEENKNVVDSYLVENIRDENINSILKKIIDSNNLELIPNTVLQINKIVLENIIDIEIIYELQKQYDKNTMEDLVTNINKAFDIDRENDIILDYSKKILEIIAIDTDNEKYITLSAEHIYQLIVKSPNECMEFIKCMVVFERRISKEVKRKFIDWTKSNVNVNRNTSKNIKQYPIISLNILNTFRNDIETSEYDIIGKDIIENSNDDICNISLSLLRFFRDSFEGDEIQDEYKKFLLKYIDYIELRGNIVDDIFQYFSNKDYEQRFVDEIIKYEDILSKEKYLNKFISQFNDEEKAGIFEKTIDNAEFKYIENIKNLFSLYLGDNYLSIIRILLDRDLEDSSAIYLIAILELVVLEIDIDIKYKIKIGAILLKVCDESNIIEVVDVCKKIGVINDKTLRKDWGEVCYNTFRNTNLDEQKTAIFSLVLDNEIEPSFRGSGKEKRGFSDNELALIKNYKKTKPI